MLAGLASAGLILEAGCSAKLLAESPPISRARLEIFCNLILYSPCFAPHESQKVSFDRIVAPQPTQTFVVDSLGLLLEPFDTSLRLRLEMTNASKIATAPIPTPISRFGSTEIEFVESAFVESAVVCRVGVDDDAADGLVIVSMVVAVVRVTSSPL